MCTISRLRKAFFIKRAEQHCGLCRFKHVICFTAKCVWEGQEQWNKRRDTYFSRSILKRSHFPFRHRVVGGCWTEKGKKKHSLWKVNSLMWTGKTVQLSNRTKSFKFLTTFFQLMSSGEKFPSDRGQRKYSELIANHVFRLGFLIYPFKDIIISYVTGLLKVLSVYLISASPGKMICVNVNRAMNTSRPHYKYAGWLSHQELNNSSEVLKRGKKAGERLGRDIFKPCLQQLTESFWLHIRTFFSNFSGDKTGYFDKMLGHFQSYLCWQNQEF